MIGLLGVSFFPSLALCVRPLVDKISGAIASGMIGFVAVWVGMTSGASAATIKES